jgi:hypothetical protein
LVEANRVVVALLALNVDAKKLVEVALVVDELRAEKLLVVVGS